MKHEEIQSSKRLMEDGCLGGGASRTAVGTGVLAKLLVNRTQVVPSVPKLQVVPKSLRPDQLPSRTLFKSEQRASNLFLLLIVGCIIGSMVLTFALTLLFTKLSKVAPLELAPIPPAPLWSESIDQMLAYQKQTPRLPLKPLAEPTSARQFVTPEGNRDIAKVLPASLNLDEPQVFLMNEMQITKKRASSETRDKIIDQITQEVYAVVGLHKSEMDPVRLTSLIVSESLQAEFDPLMTLAVVRTESKFNPNLISPIGAQGLMQLMDSTKAYIENIEAIPPGDRKSLLDARYNLRLGIAYLKHLKQEFKGNMSLALMAYNWGPLKLKQTLDGSGASVPHSVLQYSMRILDDHSTCQARVNDRILFR